MTTTNCADKAVQTAEALATSARAMRVELETFISLFRPEGQGLRSEFVAAVTGGHLIEALQNLKEAAGEALDLIGLAEELNTDEWTMALDEAIERMRVHGIGDIPVLADDPIEEEMSPEELGLQYIGGGPAPN